MTPWTIRKRSNFSYCKKIFDDDSNHNGKENEKEHVHTHIHILEKERAAAAAAKSLQLCPTLCDPIDVWQPTPISSPGEFHRQRSLGATVRGIAKSQT